MKKLFVSLYIVTLFYSSAVFAQQANVTVETKKFKTVKVSETEVLSYSGYFSELIASPGDTLNLLLMSRDKKTLKLKLFFSAIESKTYKKLVYDSTKNTIFLIREDAVINEVDSYFVFGLTFLNAIVLYVPLVLLTLCVLLYLIFVKKNDKEKFADIFLAYILIFRYATVVSCYLTFVLMIAFSAISESWGLAIYVVIAILLRLIAMSVFINKDENSNDYSEHKYFHPRRVWAWTLMISFLGYYVLTTLYMLSLF